MSNRDVDQQFDPQGIDAVSTANRSGGVEVAAQEVSIGGDVVGRDKIVDDSITIVTSVERALTETEIAGQAAVYDRQRLAEAVTAYRERLQHLGGRPDFDRDRRNPFRALLAYDLGEAAAFCGRDEALRATQACVARDPLTVLHASSGLGLTSLLKAGLMPRLLANGELPLYVRPSNMPVALALKHSLLPRLEYTRFSSASLRDFLRQVSELCGGQPLIVILDQFEEFFARPDTVQQAEFVGELAQCLADDLLPVRWILALHSDWFGHLSTFQPLVRQPFANQFLLPALTADEAREVIVHSAQGANLVFESDLIDRLIAALGQEAIVPAQLQIVCYTLVDLLKPGESQLTLALYEHAGGAASLLRDYLESTLTRNFRPIDRQIAWQILTDLSDQKNSRATEDEVLACLQADGLNEADVKRVLDLLVTNHLILHSDEHYQLASASLLPRIRQWATERTARELAHAEAVRQLDRVRRSALRGMFGGALGFSLAFLIVFGPQTVDKSLLGYLTAYRALPGAIAGLLLVLMADIAVASYHGRRYWLRWIAGCLAGTASFAVALLFHTALRSANNPQALAETTLVGALWGASAGTGLVWVLNTEQSSRRLLIKTITVTLASGVVLWAASAVFANSALGTLSSPFTIVLAGTVMPLCVLIAALWPRLVREEKDHG